jgi:hypothetical protein
VIVTAFLFLADVLVLSSMYREFLSSEHVQKTQHAGSRSLSPLQNVPDSRRKRSRQIKVDGRHPTTTTAPSEASATFEFSDAVI